MLFALVQGNEEKHLEALFTNSSHTIVLGMNVLPLTLISASFHETSVLALLQLLNTSVLVDLGLSIKLSCIM